MLNTNITNFRKNIFSLLEQTIKYNEPVNISTKAGNAVIISEEDYNGLMETVYHRLTSACRKMRWNGSVPNRLHQKGSGRHTKVKSGKVG